MPFLARGSDQIYYEVVGDGPPIILIHDALLHSPAWDAQVAPLAAHHQVVRYDRPGYGRSSAPSAAYTHRDDLHALVEQVGGAPVTLIGASIGSGIALDFALAYPALVQRLVLAGPALPGFDLSGHFVERLRAIIRPLREAQDIAATIANWTNDAYIVAPGQTAARARVQQLLIESPQNLTNPSHLLQRTPLIRPGQLQALNHPTLVVVGAFDIADSHAQAGAIAFTMPNVQRIVLRDAGHLSYLDRPDEFTDAVLAFLNRTGSIA